MKKYFTRGFRQRRLKKLQEKQETTPDERPSANVSREKTPMRNSCPERTAKSNKAARDKSFQEEKRYLEERLNIELKEREKLIEAKIKMKQQRTT